MKTLKHYLFSTAINRFTGQESFTSWLCPGTKIYETPEWGDGQWITVKVRDRAGFIGLELVNREDLLNAIS